MIDSHCHLDREPLISNLSQVLTRAKDVGLKKLLTICTTNSGYDNILEIVSRDPMIYGTFGIHPHETKNHFIERDEIIKQVKMNSKIIGVGETGLDFYYNNSDKDTQLRSFQNHIEAAINLKIPLIIHSRNAENEIMDIFNKYKNYDLKILMHCYTGSAELAKKLLNFDVFFSASGIITFKKSCELRETFKTIPADRLLIETDSPYLAPEPLRGKKNEPSFIQHTAEKLANLKEISYEDLKKITSLNFNRLFC